MPPVLLVLAMPSNCSVPVMCPTAATALPTEAIANALRLHWARAPHQSLSTVTASVYEVGVYHGPEEACWVLTAYFRCPSTAHSAACPRPPHSRPGQTGRQGLARAWRTPPWAEDGGPQMRRG